MKKIFTLLSIFLFVFSCTKENTETNNTIELPKVNEILGEKLENPYSVTNMQKAYNQLSAQTRSSNPIEIEATHLYVKFAPKTELQLSTLKRDTTLDLYSYPLDYEFSNEMTEYHDPSIPEDVPTYQYAAVKIGKQLPDSIKYEILEKLYIPDEYDGDEDETITRSSNGLNVEFAESLVDKALEITDNEEEEEANTRGSRSSWRPLGHITYHDEIHGYRGMEGVEVKAKRWFTTHKGIANSSGYYECDGTFKRVATYKLDLEIYHFKIKGANGVQTSFTHETRHNAWDYHFSRGNSQGNYHAAIAFRAAHHYYHRDIGDLTRPPQNSFWRAQLDIKVMNETHTSNGVTAPAKRFMGLGNTIKLYNPQNSMLESYATAIHELAHIAHWRMIVQEDDSNRNRDYNFAEDKMCESWATGVQWYITKKVYPDYKGRYDPYATDYTNVVIDLIDTELDNSDNNGKSSSQGDDVSGYTIVQIEKALIGCNTWDKWKNSIKNKYNNSTEGNLDALFDAWK